MDKESEKVYLSISNPSSCSPSINNSFRLQAYTEVEEDLLTDELKSIFADVRSVILGTNPAEIQIPAQSTRSVERMRPSEVQHIEAIASGTDASLKNDVRYGQCRKNHAANIGGYAVDGCGEFMASGEEGTAAALNCAACHCHRNFHIQEVENETLCECHRTRRVTSTSPQILQALSYYRMISRKSHSQVMPYIGPCWSFLYAISSPLLRVQNFDAQNYWK